MLKLYILPTCPFGVRVKKKLSEMNISYKEIDINEPENERELIERGGKRQVPYFVDEEKNIEMYESSDIVNYLEETYGNK